MIPRMMILVLALTLIPVSVSAKIYKWVDDNGKSHFTDNPTNIPTKYKNKTRSIKEAPPRPPSHSRPPAYSEPVEKKNPLKRSLVYKEAAGKQLSMIDENLGKWEDAMKSYERRIGGHRDKLDEYKKLSGQTSLNKFIDREKKAIEKYENLLQDGEEAKRKLLNMKRDLLAE